MRTKSALCHQIDQFVFDIFSRRTFVHVYSVLNQPTLGDNRLLRSGFVGINNKLYSTFG